VLLVHVIPGHNLRITRTELERQIGVAFEVKEQLFRINVGKGEYLSSDLKNERGKIKREVLGHTLLGCAVCTDIFRRKHGVSNPRYMIDRAINGATYILLDIEYPFVLKQI